MRPLGIQSYTRSKLGIGTKRWLHLTSRPLFRARLPGCTGISLASCDAISKLVPSEASFSVVSMSKR